MSMVGDGLEGQPTEGVVSLTDLAAQLDGDEDSAPVESGEESEDADEAEGSEAEEQEDAESGEEEGEEPTFTIKVDGKDVTLTQSELIERAQKGTDYTNKTMAVAEERKAVEAERTKAAEHRQHWEQTQGETLKRLQAYTQFMESDLGQAPDTAMLDYDPAGFLRQKEQYEARKGKLHQAYAAIQNLTDEQARQRQAWISEKAESAEKVLRDTLPGWNDATLNDLADYAGKLGLNPQSADVAMLEPGFWQLAQKAKAYDALQAEKAKLKPVAQLPKVQKPGASNQPPQLAKRQEALKRHKANPSIQSLADLL